MAIVLAGCANSPLATLKSYPDNRVAFVLKDKDIGRTIYGLYENKDKIFAYRFSGMYYNAQDIESISSDGYSGSILRLKNGQVYQLPALYINFFICDNVNSCAPADPGNNPIYGSGSVPVKAVYANDGPYYPRLAAAYLTASYSQSVQIKSGKDYLAIEQLFDNTIEQVKKEQNDRAKLIQEQLRTSERARAERTQMIEHEAQDMRTHAKIGTATNCGRIFDVRLPMVGVQSSIGMQYIQLDRLYGPSAGCQFSNGVYVGPTY